MSAQQQLRQSITEQIVAALENQFGVRLPDEELDNYTTVRLITDTVTRLRV